MFFTFKCFVLKKNQKIELNGNLELISEKICDHPELSTRFPPISSITYTFLYFLN